MQVVKKVVTAAFLLLTASSGVEASTQVSKISYLIVRASDGLTYVQLIGTRSGKPACAARDYFIIRDENSEAGKKQYAMLLAAKSAEREIIITGMDSCLRWSDGEDINSVQFQDN